MRARRSTVAADGIRRAAFHGLAGELKLVGRDRLLPDVTHPLIVIAAEEGGGNLAADVAVDTARIVVEGAGNVERIFIGSISHEPEAATTRELREID